MRLHQHLAVFCGITVFAVGAEPGNEGLGGKCGNGQHKGGEQEKMAVGHDGGKIRRMAFSEARLAEGKTVVFMQN